MSACPCNSKKEYEACCKPYHLGKKTKDTPTLVRARYSAYVKNLPEYIIETTHPTSPQFQDHRKKWEEDIREFCEKTEFQELEILEVKEEEEISFVSFFVRLLHQNKDVSFTEKSLFEKREGKWFYKVGKLISGKAPHLMSENHKGVLPLAYYGEPILRKKAEPVVLFDKELKKLVDQMIETMDFYNGMGLAAPQVHHSIQLFIIRVPEEENFSGKVKVFVNPTLLSQSEKTWKTLEGCLSIPTIQGKVVRPEEISLEYHNLEGEKQIETVSGWEARVILHEYDHIKGTLFLDHLSKVERKELEPFLARLRDRVHKGKEL